MKLPQTEKTSFATLPAQTQKRCMQCAYSLCDEAFRRAIPQQFLGDAAKAASNGGRCPLSDLAARYTDERASNFDIYLPNWLASHNKTVFGTVFVANELIVLWCWLKGERSSSANDGGNL